MAKALDQRTIILQARLNSGDTRLVEISAGDSIQTLLLKALAAFYPEGANPNLFLLAYGGRILDPRQTVGEIGLKEAEAVQVVPRRVGSGWALG